MAMPSRIRLPALLAFAALCLCSLYAADARADHWEEHIDLVYDQLKSDHEYYEGRGYTVVNYIMGKLDDDDEVTWTFYLSRRTAYVVTGACDGDCDDLDLRLKTASGIVVDRDEDPGYWPEVSVTPTRSQNYSIEVEMYDCNADPCYYGITVFEK